MTVPLRPMGPGENITFFNYHQRRGLEGYDIEWMMDAAGMNTPVPAQTQEVGETASLEGPQG